MTTFNTKQIFQLFFYFSNFNVIGAISISKQLSLHEPFFKMAASMCQALPGYSQILTKNYYLFNSVSNVFNDKDILTQDYCMSTRFFCVPCRNASSIWL